jgi:hypothetical protein
MYFLHWRLILQQWSLPLLPQSTPSFPHALPPQLAGRLLHLLLRTPFLNDP